MIRSWSCTVTSLTSPCQAWLTPNSRTISSRVPVTLHTLEYRLRMLESSQRTLIGLSPDWAGRFSARSLIAAAPSGGAALVPGRHAGGGWAHPVARARGSDLGNLVLSEDRTGPASR